MRVLVVGGGIIGLLSAFYLQKAGCQVLLLDKQNLGTEASWAGGGIISPLYPWRYPPAVTTLAQQAQAAYPTLQKELLQLTGIDIELNTCGLLMVEPNDARDALVWAKYYQQPIEVLSPLELRRLAPVINNFQSGVLLPHIANVRNPRLLQALIKAVNLMGVQVISHRIVEQWEVKQQRVLAVQIDKKRYEVDHVLIAAGAWTNHLLTPFNYSLPIKPIKGQMLLYKLPTQVLNKMILHQGHYLIPRLDGHILCGSTLEDVGFDKMPSLVARETLQQSAERMMPSLAEHKPIKQWAGLRPASPNGIPFIGHVPHWQNVSVNAGQFRNGLVLAPASAQLISQLITQQSTTVDASPYQLL
ncbi:glycine oxidase ThiO [Agitococcus lubricus]|uniref:Glycine oxidase n=1 Tax=Agitococcus lubricus TaxID=1077255 RepID=A0A2T5J2D7_9GAMM|nr:glycine oxidase ThiO [Agitococcus lubricus]PTQ90674.1 glycine oxidase [Agitococcus lubricus]